ncbi:MAG: hypothetical protein KDA79_00010 [Planctomycetaceae bacterium]|nr:hypothetical protein [Planctomycetaceae bacterium]
MPQQCTARSVCPVFLLVLAIAVPALGRRPVVAAADQPASPTLAAVRAVDPHVLPTADRDAAGDMVYNHQVRRRTELNDRSTSQWHEIAATADWEKFREEKIGRLRQSLNVPEARPAMPTVHVTNRWQGGGFQVRNLAFVSPTGMLVSANLYLPARKPTEPAAEPAPAWPGILIVHSHHRPKEHAELQDMGMTWARAGCAVLVPDLLGYGERRQHRFASAEDYDGEFRVSRQDYFFRYDNGVRLHLAGSSLMAWFANDLLCCVDVLLAQPGVDEKKIAILGSVAGGGDPAAVVAALDSRIRVAVPFNFGGPQPENRFPLPADSDRSFNYAGGAYWDTARNLRRSAIDGFMPWVIVGAVAPRGLIYAHEFAWDRDRDPVWARYEQLWSLYDARDQLGFTHGRGSVRGRPPEATHCTHIGREHRKMIHPHFHRWLGVEVTADSEYSKPVPASRLQCFTRELPQNLPLQTLSDVLPPQVERSLTAARQARDESQSPRQQLQRELEPLLGEIAPADSPQFTPAESVAGKDGATSSRLLIQRGRLTVEPGIDLPLIVLQNADRQDGARRPAVVAVAQTGKQAFLKHGAEEIATLIDGGCMVVLCDLRGTGETSLADSRSPYSNLTSRTCTEFMLGGTLAGSRLKDLRTVLGWLRSRKDIDTDRIALWGDSFAAVNSPDTKTDVPRRIDSEPAQSEPGGMLLSLLAAVYEDGLAAVSVSGGLLSLAEVLQHSRVEIPHDVVIPGLLKVADVSDLLRHRGPLPVRVAGLVDAANRRVAPEAVTSRLRDAGLKTAHPAGITVATDHQGTGAWLLQSLQPHISQMEE